MTLKGNSTQQQIVQVWLLTLHATNPQLSGGQEQHHIRGHVHSSRARPQSPWASAGVQQPPGRQPAQSQAVGGQAWGHAQCGNAQWGPGLD